MNSTLFDGENSDSEGELKINRDYASNYNSWRQKEELNKLKTKYGEAATGSTEEESSSESSSEEGEDESDEQFDKDFYKALARLKSKDPRIYNEDVSFFKDTNQAVEKRPKPGEKSKKEKALYLRDYERKIMLEREGKYSESEDEDEVKEKKKATSKTTYVQEQEELKESFKQVLKDEEQVEDADLLKPKLKSESEKSKEEADFKEWLKGQQLEIGEEEKQELQPLRDFWNNPKLDANEKFLRDYILNNKFMEKNNPEIDLDYEQVIHDSDENLSEDERNIEEQEQFEYKYNYRFEEPDQEFIKRYPRTMENTLRKKDTRRAQKRVEVKERKEADKVRKMEELKQLKALKRKEIEEKIEKLREITGNDDIKFDEIDLDADFDPNEHDKKMTEIFNEEYYNVPEDDAKPEFPEIDEELELEGTWDNYEPAAENGQEHDGPHCEDEDFNMDADYDPSKPVQEELVESTRKRKRGRRSKFAELLAKEKPKFDPEQFPSYQEYFDKYYSLDYEDMIGDIPCRFKYRKVVPNDYGLSVEEVLMADDKELNKWCSLKRALQYKSEHIELNDIRSYRQKAANEALKKKILKSLYKSPDEEEEEAKEKAATETEAQEGKKKRRRKKKSQKDSENPEPSVSQNSQQQKDGPVQNGSSKKAEKRKRKEGENLSSPGKKSKSKNAEPETEKPEVEGSKPEAKAPRTEAVDTENKEQKKKKKKKQKIKPEANSSGKALPVSGKKTKGLKRLKKDKRFKANGDQGLVKDAVATLNPERLKTYGINARKLKNKLKYGNSRQNS